MARKLINLDMYSDKDMRALLVHLLDYINDQEVFEILTEKRYLEHSEWIK